ncbi:histidine kinase dimerization/phosphoacceptor domain -containing protein [Zobellia russellii]|uniref:histidine kinase dimerization/phosphoacceptor domain -containing protein n=1 Tax=Zobellia russellii TaxID=248907 RepID=UPI001BFEF18B|nr:histidine kinase dimerization/phosphoacceptor domain -containing protein [Zobellia russellii]MBT9188911.1 histidine kinase [Zobellia russellii]
MRTILPKVVAFWVFSILNCSIICAQIIGSNGNFSYKKVFVETDNFGASYLDTLERAYPSARPDTLKFSILNDLAYYWHTRNLNKALQFTKEGLQLTKTGKDSVWEGRFQITEAAILLRMEKLDSAEKVLESARCKVLEKDLPHLNTQLGYVYERRGKLGKAADYALECLRLGEKLNDKRAIAMAYSDLSNLFWKQSKFKTGLEYGLKSLALYEERGINDLDYDFTLFVVANNYLALADYEQALNYFQHAIVVGERYGFYNNLSDVYMLLVDTYSYLNEFEKAEEAGVNAIKYAELLENNFLLMRSWLAIGKLKNLEGEYAKAVECLEKSITIATEDFGDAFFLSQAYEALGKAHAGNHQYKEAYAAFARYDKYKADVFTAEADKRTSQLRTEFDVAGKEDRIQSQEALISKQKTTQKLTVVILALLLLLLILSYKAIQNKFKVNKILQKQNEEKEFLLKEIHHRVKNNLETVSSLLSLQAARINDEDVLKAMRESQYRVQSMGMIHQKLYTGKNLAAVEMKGYFQQLGEYIVDAFGANETVSLEVVMEPMELDVDMAIPIGLIVNELFTNSLKYAFPNGRKGKIKISLREEEQMLQLDVRDDGIGNWGEGVSQGTGFGTQLVDLLTKQLDGKMVLNVSQGTAVSIQFQLHKAA